MSTVSPAVPADTVAPSAPNSNAFSFIAKLDVLNHCGEEARRWLALFSREENSQLAGKAFTAMVLFRRHDLRGALDLLDSLETAVLARNGEMRSVNRLLRRWHLSAMAYYHYLQDDTEAALKALDDAHEEIRALVSELPFLMPVVTHCIDFRIQRARIARRENRWRDVKAHLDVVRAIYADRVPFCVAHSGRPIKLSDLGEFYRSLPLTEKQKSDASFALDPDYPHFQWIDRLEQDIFALPDLVIPYP